MEEAKKKMEEDKKKKEDEEKQKKDAESRKNALNSLSPSPPSLTVIENAETNVSICVNVGMYRCRRQENNLVVGWREEDVCV